MITPVEQQVFDHMTKACTNHPTDRRIRAAGLIYAKVIGAEAEYRKAVLEARSNWLDWLTKTQRHWQRTTRRPARAKHHDSINIRETYVRCRPTTTRVSLW